MDVTKQAEVEAAARTLLTSGLPLWAVVNNAGIAVSGFLDWGHDVDDLRRVFEVNVFGVVRVAKNCLPLLRETPGSRLINVGSLAGRVAAPNIGHYCMSKHSVRAFSDALRRELQVLAPRGPRRNSASLHVITIEPTFYRTNIVDAAIGARVRERMWAETADSVRVSYPEHLLERMRRAQARVDRFSRTNLSEVIETMVEAVIRLHPKPFYRCCGLLDHAIWALAAGPEVLVDLALKLRSSVGGSRR